MSKGQKKGPEIEEIKDGEDAAVPRSRSEPIVEEPSDAENSAKVKENEKATAPSGRRSPKPRARAHRTTSRLTRGTSFFGLFDDSSDDGGFDMTLDGDDFGFGALLTRRGSGGCDSFESFSSSTCVEVGPDGRQRVREKTRTKRASGDVEEEHETERDSGRGTERMQVRRRLGSKERVVEQSRVGNGAIQSREEVVGMDPDKAHEFDSEWRMAAEERLGGGERRLAQGSSARVPTRNALAITGGNAATAEESDEGRKKKAKKPRRQPPEFK